MEFEIINGSKSDSHQDWKMGLLIKENQCVRERCLELEKKIEQLEEDIRSLYRENVNLSKKGVV